MDRLGVVETLTTLESSFARQQGSPQRIQAASVRIILPSATKEDVDRAAAALRARASDTDLLVALTPDLSELVEFPERIEEVLLALSGHAITLELVTSPPLTSVWSSEVDIGALATALARAANKARRRGIRVVWSMRAPITIADASTMDRYAFIRSADPILLDLTRSPSTDGWCDALRFARNHWGHDRIWLAAGLRTDACARAPAELEAHAHALELGAPRLYWEPASDLRRLWRRLGLARTSKVIAPDRSKEWGAAIHNDPRSEGRVLVTGGAGFVGCNLAARLLDQGRQVVVLDNLARDGVERNLDWLRTRWGSNLRVIVGDIRDERTVRAALAGVGRVFHLAGQVAVTSSLDDPLNDFDINARGTIVVLEELRRLATPPGIIFTSTNKVYGNLEDVSLDELEQRYQPSDEHLRSRGIDETRPLDLHSPYGCSKGAGDQYMLDYANSYGIPALVFRMSCIYGPRQFGTEDQGWVAHFFRRALDGREITIYGDGKQVRDVLFIDDLVDAFLLASREIGRLQGRAFNIGGGPDNALSLLELLDRIFSIHASRPRTTFASWRRGDQRYYVSDTSRFAVETGWKPSIALQGGLEHLYDWLRELEPHESIECSRSASLQNTPAEARTHR